MSRTQLLGKLDPDTRQWNDGVLTNTAVAVNAEPNGNTSKSLNVHLQLHVFLFAFRYNIVDHL